ncbi:MAG TPA: hypothetical protein PK821_01565 [Victivallales bacterium]|nr:hypothetical protein [Victivallales bacterium]
MKAKLSIIFAAMTLILSVDSGTVSFKDGTRISDAEITSISDGRITIKKDKKERSFELNAVESFYKTDVGGDSIPGDFADYTVNIVGIKMPEKGKNTKGEKEKCEVRYIISRNEDKNNKIKIPYFYLYVLTSASGDYEDRKIFSYNYPEQAKVKSKGYDEAAILKKALGFDRKIMDYGEIRARTSFKNFGDRTISFELSGVDEKKIIAYRLVVWGNDSIVAEKSWKSSDHKVGDRWWERLD